MYLTIHERRDPGDESVLLHVKRPAGKRKLDLSGLEPLHNLHLNLHKTAKLKNFSLPVLFRISDSELRISGQRPVIGFDWLCFLPPSKHEILHNYLSYRDLHAFRPTANWLRSTSLRTSLFFQLNHEFTRRSLGLRPWPQPKSSSNRKSS